MKRLIASIKADEIVKELSNSFDYTFDGQSFFDVPSLALPSDFSIGLIVGPSGSGKSSMLDEIGKPEEITWDAKKAICSHFASADDARSRLHAVGLNSVPSWMKPFHCLSNGEQFRAKLARQLKNNAVVDEFTSVVDRNVAFSCSNAIQRYIRSNSIKSVVFASCHYDIIPWLQPDWIYDTATNQFSRRSERRPDLLVEVLPCTTDLWPLFSKHHYLSGDINKGAKSWIALWNGQPVGFAAVIAYPSGTVSNAWRGHRTVILPEFQGMGIGVRLSDCVAEIMKQHGFRYFSKTASKSLGEYRNASNKWKPTSKNMQDRQDYNVDKRVFSTKHTVLHAIKHADRFCYSHEYIG